MGTDRISARLFIPPPPVGVSVHGHSTHETWTTISVSLNNVRLDGSSLDIAQLVRIAKYGAKAELKRRCKIVELGESHVTAADRVEESVAMLKRHLDRGDLIYGVNTGYGGSADTRTNNVVSLQTALIQHQQTGILTRHDTNLPKSTFLPPTDQEILAEIGQEWVPDVHLQFREYERARASSNLGSLSMPTSWVRGLMVQRVNSIIRGHSAVSLRVIEAILVLLNRDLTPVIPCRGSISASGDLQPLAYVAGAIQGSPDIFVRTWQGDVWPAGRALDKYKIKPVALGAKEGLGLLNGTAASVSVASLAMHEANHLAVLTQVLTAMAVEALCGTAESFSPFIAKVRPHRGQVEVAANIYGFLRGSRLSSGLDSEKDMHMAGLAQDRYPLRTSSQWIGPQLEDLLLATEQISVELNSTTDNPLTDADADLIHHGGNFQATSITSAMEKTRTCIQMLGKLLFAQSSELLNSALNKGLPPNLAADDPSLSFTCKGVDINLAAYMSELAYLAHPVSSHIQSAEMHNQAVNSLALVSARYTTQSVEIFSQMCAAYLFALCQALDLRVMQARFLARAHERCTAIAREIMQHCYAQYTDPTGRSYPVPEETQLIVMSDVWSALKEAWNANINEDLKTRAAKTAQAAAMLYQYRVGSTCCTLSLEGALGAMLQSEYTDVRSDMFERHLKETPAYLGQAAKKMYVFVRKDVGVPFHRGLEDDPPVPPGHSGPPAPWKGRGPPPPPGLDLGSKSFYAPGPDLGEPYGVGSQRRRTIGNWISLIYEALRDGEMHRPVMEAFETNERQD